MGFLKFLGFAIPFAVAFDRKADPPRDAMPSPGRCCLCKRQKEDTYRLSSAERVCADDIAGVVHRSGARRINATPRPVGEWPLEKVAEQPHQLEGDMTWWESQFE